ncbi:MAG: molybdenum cofactor guanylyltransferase [Anaerovoracaceae bacterium]|jgi:molybdopterin-guanine dinucleotide biosynthesis protein A
MQMITDMAIILAGGKSTRMGFDKQELLFNGKPAAIYLAELLEDEFKFISIVTNNPSLYKNSKYNLLEDIVTDKGPLGGLYTGLMCLNNGYAYLTACDMPFINFGYIQYMKNIIHNNKSCKAVITRYSQNMLEPFNAFYSACTTQTIKEILDKNSFKMSSLFNTINTHYISEAEARIFSPDWTMFANINTKEDLKLINVEYSSHP